MFGNTVPCFVICWCFGIHCERRDAVVFVCCGRSVRFVESSCFESEWKLFLLILSHSKKRILFSTELCEIPNDIGSAGLCTAFRLDVFWSISLITISISFTCIYHLASRRCHEIVLFLLKRRVQFLDQVSPVGPPYFRGYISYCVLWMKYFALKRTN